jgi:hypothetical protein
MSLIQTTVPSREELSTVREPLTYSKKDKITGTAVVLFVEVCYYMNFRHTNIITALYIVWWIQNLECVVSGCQPVTGRSYVCC